MLNWMVKQILEVVVREVGDFHFQKDAAFDQPHLNMKLLKIVNASPHLQLQALDDQLQLAHHC